MLATVMEDEHNDDPTHHDMIFSRVFYDLGGGKKKGGGAFLPHWLSSRQSGVGRASGRAFWAISRALNKTVSCSDLCLSHFLAQLSL